MMIKQMRQHFVGFVPLWLAEVVMASPDYSTPDIFADYEKLSSIVSNADVSFYHWMQSTAATTVAGFTDMESISMKPCNLKWLETQAGEVASGRDRFTVELAKKDSDHCSIDASMLKPYGVDGNTLLLVSTQGETNPLTLERDCVGVLSEHMTYDEYKLYDIFKAYMLK